MSKGTIIYIGGFELPDKNAAAHRVLSNAKILRDLGYKVVFVEKNGITSSNSLEAKQYFGFECFETACKKNKLQILKNLYDICFLKEVCSKYKDIKVVIAYNYPAVALNRISHYCRKNKITCVADVTEWYGTKDQSLSYKIIKGTDTFIRMRIVQKHLDGIIVISKFLMNYYHKQKNLIYLPPLVDINEKKWAPCNISQQTLNFVYVGHPSSEKERLDIIVNEFLGYSDKITAKLTIVGITKQEYLQIYHINENVFNQGKKENVEFLGKMTHNESLEYVKRASFAFIIRSKNRVTDAGFPTKFVESITCGTPVIATDNSDLKDFIIEGVNGYIVSNEDFHNDLLRIINFYEPKEFNRKLFHYQNYLIQMNQFVSGLVE